MSRALQRRLRAEQRRLRRAEATKRVQLSPRDRDLQRAKAEEAERQKLAQRVRLRGVMVDYGE